MNRSAFGSMVLRIAIIIAISIVVLIRVREGWSAECERQGGKDISCGMCHAVKQETAPWFENGDLSKPHELEFWVPDECSVNWYRYSDTTMVSSHDTPELLQIYKHVFWEMFRDQIETYSVYTGMTKETKPFPIYAIVQSIAPTPFSPDLKRTMKFWIYRHGLPFEVTEDEGMEYLKALCTGERT